MEEVSPEYIASGRVSPSPFSFLPWFVPSTATISHVATAGGP
jgi:hypothetical protein